MDVDAVRRVVELASWAPSVHNTQPWRFRWDGSGLAVVADRSRQLRYVDPAGRWLGVSCGAALMFVRLAVAAAGWTERTTLLPDATDRDVLARVQVVGERDPDPAVLDLVRVIGRRHTARGRFADRPLAAPVRDAMGAAAVAERGWLRWVQETEDRTEVAVLAERAGRIQEADPAYRAELRQWRREHGVDGIPRAALPPGPATPRATPVPMRDLSAGVDAGVPAVVSRMRTPLPVERSAIAVLGTDFDGPPSWLLAGQALGRVLLTAAAAGVGCVPLTQVLDLPWTRQRLRERLCLGGFPQMVLGCGYTTLDAPTTPRRPVDELLDVRPLATRS